MAKIKYLVKTKGNPSQIYIRFYHSKDFDLNAKTGLLIDPKLFSNKYGHAKTTAHSTVDKEINPKLNSLKEYIIKCYNRDFSSGLKIDKNWIDKIIAEHHKQPLNESDNYKLYFTSFFKKYIEDSKIRINPDTGKKLSSRTISKYETTLKRIAELEESKKIKLRLLDINLNFHKQFVNYLANELLYNGTNIQKYLNIIKGVCRDAKIKGYEVNHEFEHRNFSFKRDKPFDTYLNTEEINKIFSLNFKDNERLDNARDWLIIGVWTGLRISDMKRLSKVNLKADTIEIRTVKTTANAIIPIHPDVKSILIKRDGDFPRPISDAKFNKYVKEVVAEAEIKEVIYGGKTIEVKLPNGIKTYRKKNDYYPKCYLITSHTCRRSFATNHYGKLPNKTIMAVTTHSSEAQFEKYLKQSHVEHLDKFRELWNNNN